VVNQPTKGGGWVATHEDITERKRAERALEHTRQFLDTILENVPSPILVKGYPSLRYLLINRAAEEYLGVEKSALLGKTAAEALDRSPGPQAGRCRHRHLQRRAYHRHAGQRHAHHHLDPAAGDGRRWQA
jgi:PAS domain-containing protein